MNSLQFPNMFKASSTNLVFDKDAAKQNIMLTLYSAKLELFGDPNFGTNMRRYFFEQNSSIISDLIREDILNVIQTQVPQMHTTRKWITVTIQKTKIFITIQCQWIIDKSLDTFDIELSYE